MQFPHISPETRLAKLRIPAQKRRIVIDTDTYNEIDDQFAVTYALLSPDQMSVEAIYAAPFHNSRSDGAEDGMEKSYEEILRLLDRLGTPSDGFVFKGSTDFLTNELVPQDNPAVRDLIAKAMSSPDDDPLYVVAIGAITNVASAIILEPEIINKIVVVWLGGHALHWHDTKEFNLKQDVPAARLVLDCGVPFVLIPCAGVTSHLATTMPEINAYVRGVGRIGDYLAQTFEDYKPIQFGRSSVIWDISTIAWLINAEWVPTNIVHSPVLTDQVTWSVDQSRHMIRCATYIHRDPIFRDFFTKLKSNTE